METDILSVEELYDKSWERHYQKALAKITEAKDVIPANKKIITDFVRHLDSQDKAPRTKLRYAYCYRYILQCMPDKKVSILKMPKSQIEQTVININRLPNIGEAVKNKTRIALKAIWKHFNGDGGLYVPREVAFIKTVEKSGRENLTYEDLLSENEITKLINATLNPRDAALIALMADGPFRTHEILRLKRKHLNIECSAPYVQIPTNTKTGSRRIPLVNSLPYLIVYLNSVKGLNAEDSLFMRISWDGVKHPLTDPAMRGMLHKVAKRAGVPHKKCYPYNFRHRWISQMAPKISNSVVEGVAGWVKGSNMHRVYEHLNPSHIDDEVRRAYGIEVKKEATTLKVTTQKCGVCGGDNGGTNTFCKDCGRALTTQAAIQQLQDDKVIDEAMARYLSNPDNFEQAMKAYLTKRAVEIKV